MLNYHNPKRDFFSALTIKEGSTSFPKPFSPQGTRDVPTALLGAVFSKTHQSSLNLKGGSTSHLGLLPSGKKRKPLLLVARNHFILLLADHQRSSPAAELRFAVCDRMDTNCLQAACWVLDAGCLLTAYTMLDAGCSLLAYCLLDACWELLLWVIWQVFRSTCS